MGQLRLGVIGATRNENERRLPIHPHHFNRIDADVRARIYLEAGYGQHFRRLRYAAVGLGGRNAFPRAIKGSPNAMSFCCSSPTPAIWPSFATGQVLWGWPHCVQTDELTQCTIDRRQTLIAFESMNLWSRNGAFKLHVFH